MNANPPPLGPLFDVNLTWGHWPFRRVPGDEPDTLLAKLKQHGVERAVVGSFDGVFHRDVRAANDRLAAACRQRSPELLVPCGAVNPLLPDWDEDLRQCCDVHGMRAIRLHPNYHGYALDHPAFAKLLAAAAKRELVVQLVGSLEDERTQPSLARVPHVDLKPLVPLVGQHPQLPLVVLNAFRNTPLDLAAELAKAGQVYFDLAMLEGVGGVRRLLDKLPPQRVLFGSHFPLFYFESAVLKLHESPLSAEERAAVARGNAQALFAAGARPN